MADAPVDLAAVGLKLCFTGAARSDAAAELRHLDASPGQPRQQVLQLREFHLQLAFTRARVPGKDIEDQLRAVDDARLDFALQVPKLRRGQVVVEDHNLGIRHRGGARNLLDFAFPDQRCRLRAVAPLHEFAGDLSARTEG